MKYNPEVHHRQSIRLKGYDYAQAGAYFVTICTQGREGLFGEIKNGGMKLNPAGRMVQAVWEELPGRFPDIELDEFIIMPNHVHGILVLTDKADCRGESCIRPVVGSGGSKQGEHKVRPYGTLKGTVGRIVQAIKSMTTHEYIKTAKTQRWTPFSGRLWHRNYYEHIIRNEDSLNKIREYIIHNPARWEYDLENAAGKPDGAEQDFWKVFGQKRK